MNGKLVLVIRNVSGCDYIRNNDKYIGKAYNKPVRILHSFENGSYLTDFFIPEFMNIENDYIYHGFLKIMRADFLTINE